MGSSGSRYKQVECSAMARNGSGGEGEIVIRQRRYSVRFPRNALPNVDEMVCSHLQV